MKRILFSLFLVVSILCVSAKSDEGAKIEFEKSTHNFGTIDENAGSVVTEFVFKNTGTAPLVIVDASASCGCTRPEFPKKPVQPGKSGKIKVSFNPKGQPRSFSKVVTVITNDPKSSRVKLRIKGKISK